jgi:hypothetical protein
MPGSFPTQSAEDIASQLVEQARILWGEQRADQIRGSLEQTARMLLQLRRNLPGRDIEPGCHP